MGRGDGGACLNQIETMRRRSGLGRHGSGVMGKELGGSGRAGPVSLWVGYLARLLAPCAPKVGRTVLNDASESARMGMQKSGSSERKFSVRLAR